ncbi:MAG: hypothetical protein WAV18_07300 [Roseiarcus sp.]
MRTRASNGAAGILDAKGSSGDGRPTDGGTQGIHEKAVASLGYLFVTVTPNELKVEFRQLGDGHSRRSRQNIQIAELIS